MWSGVFALSRKHPEIPHEIWMKLYLTASISNDECEIINTHAVFYMKYSVSGGLFILMRLYRFISTGK